MRQLVIIGAVAGKRLRPVRLAALLENDLVPQIGVDGIVEGEGPAGAFDMELDPPRAREREVLFTAPF